jgi:hypothetical protein
MDPSEQASKIELLKREQFYQLPRERPPDVPTAFLEPVENAIRASLIKNKRELFGSLALQVF